MYLSPDDAKSDVILAGATVLFGGSALAIVARLPLYPRQGVAAIVLGLVWIVALTALVPWLLSRHRGDGMAAFGLDGDRAAVAAGVSLALPVALAQAVLLLQAGAGFGQAMLGRLGQVAGLGSALPFGGASLPILVFLEFVALTVGAVLLPSFLAVRSREAFPRSPVTSLTELVRTFGMGSAALALLVGLVRSIGSARVLPVLINVAALVAVLLLTDRRIPSHLAAPRTTVAAPALILLLVHVFASGGFFGGGLLSGLYAGSLAAGMTIAIAALVQVRAAAWSIVPLMIAAHWWPSLLSPLAF